MNLLKTTQDPNFMQEATAAIAEFCKEVHELSYVEHGADNIVALVNQEYVFRFPRGEASATRLAYETALLQKIKTGIRVVRIPQIIRVHTHPLYVVSGYIAGNHLSGEQVRALSEEAQAAIGKDLATFIVQLNQTVSGLEVRRLRMEAGVDKLTEAWPQYFDRLFVRQRLPNEKLRSIVSQYYTLWKDYVANEQNLYAIHDDLHPSNLLFDGGQLKGIVDFGDANIGSIESEMRWLYSMGDTVLRSAIQHYQALTGTSIDYEHVRVWAIMHELSSFTDRLAKQDTASFPFIRAQANLRRWLSDFPL